MTNQASQDELEQKVDIILLAGWRYGKQKEEVLNLIRTEKLKLLDRISSHQEDLFWWTGGEYEKTKAVDMRAIAAEREQLSKLEAEL